MTVLQGGLALQGGLRTEDPVVLGAQLLGLGVAAAAAAGLVAMGYRWYVRERVPTGLGVLFGLSVVAVYLGTTGALGAVIVGDEQVLQSSSVLPNLAAFAVGAGGSLTGTRAGDRLGTDLFAATGGRNVDADVSEIVQTVGRVTSVHLPEEIADIVGYDPVPDATKEQLSGRRFLFPRRLTTTELRERLVTRLKTDYGVGHVDLELDEDGNVSYLAVGSRAAGIGPTLPPSTNAVAVRADPAHAASSGDLVQVWETDPTARVLTGELRGVAGEVATVAIDAADTPKLDPNERYKLVTLPVQERPDREFASLLRAADETMGTVTVEAGSDLVGTTVGDLGVTVVAITREDAAPETIPSRERTLAAGDVLYAIATPDALRRVETAATGPDPADATGGVPGSDTLDGADASGKIPDAEAPAGSKAGERASDAEPRSEHESTDGDALDDEPESGKTAAERPADGTDDGVDETVEVWDPDERVDVPEAAGETDANGDGDPTEGVADNGEDAGPIPDDGDGPDRDR